MMIPLSMIVLSVMRRTEESLLGAVLLHASFEASDWIARYFLVFPPDRLFGGFELILWAVALILISTLPGRPRGAM